MSAPPARFPLSPELLSDFKTAVATYILPGYAPPEPFLPRSAAVATMGSCFAQHIGETLTKLGIPAAWISVDENNNTPFITDWYFSQMVEKASAKPQVVAPVRAASLFILTVGVALQRFVGDEPVRESSDPDIPGAQWRMFSVDQLAGYMRSIIAKAREISPHAHITLTLSPIPLKGSPHHPSVFGQDCLSKSLMRVTIDKVMSEGIPNLSYWPSFEMIRWLGGHAGPYFGTGGAEDNRHVDPAILDAIMSLFVARYFKP